eukprot:9895907-Alexandrium_andersonii.AAC.1
MRRSTYAEDRCAVEVGHGADPGGHLGIVPSDLVPVRAHVVDLLVCFLLEVDKVQVRAIGAYQPGLHGQQQR